MQMMHQFVEGRQPADLRPSFCIFLPLAIAFEFIAYDCFNEHCGCGISFGTGR